MESIFEQLEQALQGKEQDLVELNRIRAACSDGVNDAGDLAGFVKRLKHSGAIDAGLAGQLALDLLFQAPLDEHAGAGAVQQSAHVRDAQRGKDQLFYELESTISDLERQNSTEYRGRYYGECRALRKALFVIGWIDEAESARIHLRVLQAHQKALQQCIDAGESIAEDELRRETFRLQQAERDLEGGVGTGAVEGAGQ